MTETYKKLIATLEEIFQLDQADLDFGIYRIMNQKRAEINDFLQNRLLKQVKETLATAGAQDSEAIAKELEETLKQARAMGVSDPEALPKVQELRALYHSAGSPEAMTNEVFSHLTSFFRRYYKEGDFISQRRYKKDVYAIPYEGEEVKLYWANHDQYYIKTSENFRDYTFKIDGGKTVHFRLKDAQTEQNNNKAQQGKERRFRLVEEDIITIEGDELNIGFTYEAGEKKDKQDELNAFAIEIIKPLLPDAFKNGLLKNVPTASNPQRTLLEKHLKDYTAKNSFDYFIHKDLGDFLSRELDFYIKNEILNIDDINLDSPQSFDRQLKVVKALKTVARKIIALLAQLEDFQKKLWLKKKMVVQADYCITLDRIPESFYADITANQTQHDEWVRLFAIDEIAGDLVTPAYSNPLSIEFLKANSFLVLDTKFFGLEWKYKLLATIDNIDEQCDGLLINSENFQALNLLEQVYSNNISFVSIDPPYNTGNDGFCYKDNFKDSSWLTMMANIIYANIPILNKQSGTIFSNIDENEFSFLFELFEFIFGKENTDVLVWRKSDNLGKADVKIVNRFKSIHENIIVSYRDKSLTKFGKIMRLPEWKNSYPNPDNDPRGNYKPGIIGLSEENSNIESAKYYTIVTPTGVSYTREWFFPKDEYERLFFDNRIYIPSNGNGVPTIKIFENEEKPYYCDSILSGFGTTTSAKEEIIDIFGYLPIGSTPKPSKLVKELIRLSTDKNLIALDYFAGTGTLGHSVIQINKEDKGTRKFVLVDMGDYFNSVTKPRIQKVIYSENWHDGKPLSRNGSSHCFKYMRLESYEDTLNNLQLKRDEQQQALLTEEHFGEEYLLHYMLDIESRESLLNLEMFKKPFGYKLKITENNEFKEQEVDLVETFNYLIGLVVKSMEIIRGNVVIQGNNLQGEKILVIWRDLEATNNQALNEFFRKLDINTRDSEFKRIYVNGDNNLENIRLEDEQWKVVLIEEEFHKRMFDTREV